MAAGNSPSPDDGNAQALSPSQPEPPPKPDLRPKTPAAPTRSPPHRTAAVADPPLHSHRRTHTATAQITAPHGHCRTRTATAGHITRTARPLPRGCFSHRATPARRLPHAYALAAAHRRSRGHLPNIAHSTAILRALPRTSFPPSHAATAHHRTITGFPGHRCLLPAARSLRRPLPRPSQKALSHATATNDVNVVTTGLQPERTTQSPERPRTPGTRRLPVIESARPVSPRTGQRLLLRG